MLSGKKILIVDDADEMRTWLRMALERRGAVVEEAANGWSALTCMTEHGPFDLVITDMRMPMLSGLDVISSARATGVATPFVLITAFGDEQLRARVEQIDAAVIVNKPFELTELMGQIEPLLEGSRLASKR